MSISKREILQCLNRWDLYAILGMWPVYQSDDIGRRVVAIYQDPSSAEILQSLIDKQEYRVEPILPHSPSCNRLQKIFGGSHG
jgi:hypothetical protein